MCVCVCVCLSVCLAVCLCVCVLCVGQEAIIGNLTPYSNYGVVVRPVAMQTQIGMLYHYRGETKVGQFSNSREVMTLQDGTKISMYISFC